MANKNVEDSITDCVKVLRYEDINSENRLFGGRLLEWIDETAGTAAARHCGCRVTTAAIDNLQFKKAAFLDDIVVIVAKLTHVGKSSLEVRTDTYVESRVDGMRRVINRAYLTPVCIDEDGNPIPVPFGRKINNEKEKAEWEGAEKRIAMRRERRKEGF